MNKAELAALIADQLDVSKKLAEDFIASFEEIVTRTLVNGDEVTIAGFGTFSARMRKGSVLGVMGAESTGCGAYWVPGAAPWVPPPPP